MLSPAEAIPRPVGPLANETAGGALTNAPQLKRPGALLRSHQPAAVSDDAVPFQKSPWTDAQLDESILRLCDEYPDVRMAACSRALEHCRRTTPPGTDQSLLTAMREILRRDATIPAALPRVSALPGFLGRV